MRQRIRSGRELLDAIARLVALLAHPDDLPVLAPLIEREILWQLLVGPFGHAIAQLGLADSNLAHVSRAISWLRDNYATAVAVPELARMAGMSESAFHHHFRGITGVTPLQFQKHLRLQEARSLLVNQGHDITGVARSVGHGSPTQFTREFRRLFGAPPRRDAANLRTTARPDAVAGASIEPV